jgi:heat shock protein HtpX
MRRHHVRQALVRANLSGFERHSLLAGPLLILAAFVAAVVNDHTGGLDRLIGAAGLASVVVCAASRGGRLYRAGVRASLPTSVARVQVRVRPARGFNATAVTLALVLPLAAAVAVVAVVDSGWLILAAVLLLGCAAMLVASRGEAWGERPYERPHERSAHASGLLERLCMRADMQVPELVVEHGPVASAWTAGGQIHVTKRLLELLDDAELEAVLAHEVAHLARRDAAAMEICSAPSRVLLAFAGSLVPWTRKLVSWGMFRTSTLMVILGVLSGPPAFVIGWISRLSVLGMSRAREFSADAAAVTLTGRPSALASALLKLERQREWTSRSDLRQVEPYAVLCIVGTAGSGLGRLLSTHPATAARVRRLEETETRIQSASHPARL